MFSRTMNRTLLALAACTLSVSALAAASDADGPELRHGRMLQHYDAKGDGVITLDEFRAAGDAMFARLDADGDGRISAEEFAAAGRQRAQHGHSPRAERKGGSESRRSEFRARWFERLDANGDGYISEAEWRDARLARFSALDADGNGVIDAEELRRHHRTRGTGERGFKRPD